MPFVIVLGAQRPIVRLDAVDAQAAVDAHADGREERGGV